jgi:hypothetical protein
MGMHQVIAQVRALHCIAVNSYCTTLKYDVCNAVFHEVYWYDIKGLQHLEIGEDNFWRAFLKLNFFIIKGWYKIYLAFFNAFSTNSSSISPLREKWGVVLHHPPNFFQLRVGD